MLRRFTWGLWLLSLVFSALFKGKHKLISKKKKRAIFKKDLLKVHFKQRQARNTHTY